MKNLFTFLLFVVATTAFAQRTVMHDGTGKLTGGATNPIVGGLTVMGDATVSNRFYIGTNGTYVTVIRTNLVITNASGLNVVLTPDGRVGINKLPGLGYALDVLGAIKGSSWIEGGYFYIPSRGYLQGVADGVLAFQNNVARDFGGLILGTNSQIAGYGIGFPRINRVRAGISITDQAGVHTASNGVTASFFEGDYVAQQNTNTAWAGATVAVGLTNTFVTVGVANTNVLLPSCNTVTPGRTITIKDGFGYAAVSNIYVMTSGTTNTIDGLTNYVLRYSFEYVTLLCVSPTNWAVIGQSSGREDLIGTIKSWCPTNMPASVTNLPVGWAYCQGQTISDPQSPFNGMAVPNTTGYPLTGATSNIGQHSGHADPTFYAATFDQNGDGVTANALTGIDSAGIDAYFQTFHIIRIK